MSFAAPLVRPLRLWCGGFTDPDGDAEGISSIRQVPDRRTLVADLVVRSPSPSFLVRHPSRPLLYATAEGRGEVRTFRVGRSGRLHPTGTPWAAGASVCHLAVDPKGHYLVASCWGDGQVVRYELDARGTIRDRFASPTPDDPHGEGRQSRAHAALVLPDGRIATTDLGVDLVRFWRYEPGQALVPDHDVVLPRESEPRHLIRHPSGHLYVIGEASVEVFVLRLGPDGRYAVAASGPATREGAATGDTAAEISTTGAGTFVHVTVRGSNRVSTLSVVDGGARLVPVADVGCGGDWPRHHLERDGHLLVANQRSHSVALFDIGRDGVPSRLVQTLAIKSPSCLIPYAAG